jgi:outer membrane protein TolC
MIALLLCLLAGSARAAQPLSLDQALAEALGQNPTLAAAELTVAQADGALVSARSVFDPNFTASGSWSRDESNQLFGGFIFEQRSNRAFSNAGLRGALPTGTSYRATGSFFNLQQTAPNISDPTAGDTRIIRQSPTFELGVSQELLRGFSSAFNRRQVLDARNGRDTAELRLIAQRQQTIAQVTRAYWQWAHTLRLAEIARERLSVAQEAARIARVQLTEGRIAPVDEVRVRTELVRARNNLLDADQQSVQAADELMILLGRRPGEELEPSSQLALPPAREWDITEAIRTAEEGNLDLRVAALEAEQAELSRRLAGHGLLPTLSVDLSANRSQVRDKQGDDPFETRPQESLQASASFAMPIGNRAARGELARASAIEAQRRINMDDQRRRLVADVARQVRLLNAAAVQVELADQEVALAGDTLAAEEARDQVGRALQRDVLDARTALFDAKARAARARMDYELAAVELLRLQGRLDVEIAR